jgi:hypothetical protein
VEDAPFLVANGEAKLATTTPVSFANGGFEEATGNKLKGFDFHDQPGEISFVDNKVVHSGKASLRLENFTANPHGHGRVMQTVKLQPHRSYRVTLWIKTEGLEPANSFRVLALAGDREVAPREFHVPSTSDWRKLTMLLNSQSFDKLSLYAGLWVGKAGKVLGDIPKVGKYVSKAVSEAVPQALFAAAQAPQHNFKSGAEAGGTMLPFSLLGQVMQGTNPIARNAARALSAAGGAYFGREGAKTAGFGEFGSDIGALIGGALGGRGYKSAKEINQGLVEGVHPDVANPRINAAHRLKLEYITPAEAGKSQLAATAQGGLGRTAEGSKLLNERSKSRQDSERRAINKTLNMIYSPGKMDKHIEAGYEQLKNVNLPPEFPLQFKDNEIIKEAKNMVENTPAYKESLKALMPKNVKLEPGQQDPQATSLVYWDHIKRAMDDMVNKAERTGNKNEARIISNTRAEMRDQMDAEFPEYKQARSLYERKMVRESLEKVFDQKEINGTNFYRALASEKKFKETLSHLKNAPEAAENLKAMRLIFNELMGPPTIKTAKGTEERGMNMARNEGDFLKHMIEHAFTRGGSDKAAIEFITSPDWHKQLDEINKISNKQMKTVAFGLALSKGISQAAGEQERKPMELELIGGRH